MPETTESQTNIPQPNDDLAVAQLIQIASLCVSAERMTKDPRVTRVKEAALKEINNSGSVELLLRIMSQQQSSPAESREEARVQQVGQWQETLRRRTESQQKNREQLEDLNRKLLETLLKNMDKS